MIEVVWEQAAAREFDRLSGNVREMMETTISRLALDPYPVGSVTLTDAGAQRRIRVGAYRIIYVVDENPSRIRIVSVGHRRDVYR